MAKLLETIGFIALFLGFAISGSMGSGYQYRANYSDESLDNKNKRMNLSLILVLVGFGCLGLGYFLSK